MSRRDRIKDLYAVPESKLAAANSETAQPVREVSPSREDRVLAGPVRSMGLALDRMEQESRDLQAALNSGAKVVELDPSLIESSFVRDRLIGFEDGSLAALKSSIAERGQEVPILVRPHPKLEGNYQVAYGHRRLHATRQLGRKVRAFIREMSDTELVVAQGVENSARQDLSYIERAIFALRLEERGFERAVIMDALSTDKGELSKLIAVARAVPDHIVMAVGPAPKTGRRRWLALAEACKDKRLLRHVDHALKAPDFTGSDSDVRFQKLLGAATEPKAVPMSETWKTPEGTGAARINRHGNTVTLVIDQLVVPDFGDFVASRLNALFEEFQSQ